MELVALVVLAVVALAAAVRGPAGSRGTSDPGGEGELLSRPSDTRGVAVWEPDVPEPVPRTGARSCPDDSLAPT